MTDQEYIAELERMVKTHLTKDGFEWFYWDVLPQETQLAREAYARATGDDSFIGPEYDEED